VAAVRARYALKLFAASLAAAALSGCAHLGPRTVRADRFDYNAAIGDSWKQQTLLNVVKMRYADIPVFVDVASIVNGYSLETNVNIGASVFPSTTTDNVGVSYLGKYTDRPTITYVPKTGEKFLRALVTPIDPKNIFLLLQSGYPADFILALSVESINGVRNRSATAVSIREADPDFLQALRLMREIQTAGGFGMRVQPGPTKDRTGVLFFRQRDLPPELEAKSAEIRRLLKLPLDQQNYEIVYSPVPGSQGELAVASRSMMQIMGSFATYVEAPDAQQLGPTETQGWEADPALDPVGRVRIHSGAAAPEDAFVAISYRKRWYWIDDNDVQTKRAFSALMLLFTLTDETGAESLPLITIPAQ
jgi:hypothetical protein